jgi:REP element-mobilizing transposase RayT
MVRERPANPPRFVDPRETPFAPPKYRGALPHIFKDGCSYFVTFCLADVAVARRAQRRDLDGTGVELAELLDAPPDSGACILDDRRVARLVEETLLHDQLSSYALSAWCVMPNHVHGVVTPLRGQPLPLILQAWKSVSAHRINRLLGRRGVVWQRETFDHLIRDERSFAKFVDYTERNPVAAGLATRPAEWPFSSARHRSGDIS